MLQQCGSRNNAQSTLQIQVEFFPTADIFLDVLLDREQ
jgi:hypothetical protein